MKKHLIKLCLLLAVISSISACSSSGSKKKCDGDGNVCRIGDEVKRPIKSLWTLGE